MNSMQKVVWSDTYRAFFLIGANANQPLKSGSAKHHLACAIALAAGSLVTSYANAASSCPNAGGNAITGLHTATCTLAPNASVTVFRPGTIVAAETAILIDYAGVGTNTIKNSGTLIGSSGVLLSASTAMGSWVNNAGGTITGTAGDAIAINGGSLSGSLTNRGILAASHDAILLQNANLGAGVNNHGALSGDRGGIVISQSTVGGGILNVGQISISTPPPHIDGVRDQVGNGIDLDRSTLNGDLRNTGSVAGGSYAGVALGAYTSTINGDILNSGRLTAADVGIIALSSTLNGNLINSGNITTTKGQGISIVDSTVTGIVNNAGEVTGNQYGLAVTESSVSGNVSNSGTLHGGTDGLRVVLGTLGGDVANRGQITANDTGILVFQDKISGSVVNTGTVIAPTGVLISASKLGDFVNSGSVFGSTALYNATLTGTLRNQGRLQNQAIDGNAALSINSSSQLAQGIVNSGSIESLNANGIDILQSTVTGGLRNNDKSSITGGLVGLNIGASSVIDSGIHNAGFIAGRDAVVISSSTVQGGIINTASLLGGSLGQSGLAIADSSVSGGIGNSGIISGGSYGVQLSDTTLIGDLYNSGTLVGGTGLLISGSTLTGSLRNSGLIIGANDGLTLDNSTVTGRFINAGTLSGNTYALNVIDGARLDDLVIAGAGTAKFIGTVHAPDTQVTLSSNAAYQFEPGNRFEVRGFSNNGTLGLGVGTATIVGDYQQSAAATLNTTVTDAAHYGQLVVTGTATLPAQARIYVDVANPTYAFTAASLNNVISAGTLLSPGTFQVSSNSQLFDFNGVKDGNSVNLAPVAKSSNGVAQAVASQNTSAGRSAARVLDRQFATASSSALTPFFATATSAPAVASAVTQTLPLTANAATHTSQATLSTIADVIQSRVDANTGMAAGEGFYGDQHVWMKPFGSWIDQNGHNQAPGYNASIFGMAFGADARISSTTQLGLAFSYAKADTNSDVEAARQSANIDIYQLMGYGSYTLAPDTELSFHAGVGQNRNEGERRLDLAGNAGKASAHYSSWTADAGIELGKAFTLSEKTRFIPSVRADYTWIKDDSYHESGPDTINPLLLAVDSRRTDQLVFGVDGKITHEILPGTQLKANLGVGYDVLHDNDSIIAAYAGAPGQSFATRGLDPSPWILRGGLGVATTLRQGVEVSVNYDVQTRTAFNNQSASVKVQIPF